jgi:hypothetical protein
MTETRRRAKSTLAEKVVAPLVAAATSAVVGYLVRKGPRFVERTLLPKLREAGRGAGDAAGTLPERAKSVLSGAGDVAETLTERARSASGGAARSAGGGSTRPTRSADELERRRRARARHRATRRKSTS